MPAVTQSNEKTIKAVVAFLDGRRLKGHIFAFSSTRPGFWIFPLERPHGGTGQEVKLSELKAVFFVRDFAGGEEQNTTARANHPSSRHIEVTFCDGERIRGFTDGFSTARPGFFMFPEEADVNNLRIFVVNQHVREVKLLEYAS